MVNATNESRELTYYRALLWGLWIWLVGALALWLLEVSFIIAGLPGYKLLQDTMSLPQAIYVVLTQPEMATAFLIYSLSAVLLASVTTTVVYHICRQTSATRIITVNIVAFLSTSFAVLAAIWIESEYLHPLLATKAITAISLFLTLVASWPFVSYRLVALRGLRTLLPSFHALALAQGSLIFGLIFFSKWHTAGFVTTKGLSFCLVLLLACTCIFFTTRYVLSRLRALQLPYCQRRTAIQTSTLLVFLVTCALISLSRGLSTPSPSSAPAEAQKQRPNVLLIVMDTTRADHLTCYGYPRPTTPQIDKIALQGTLFTNTVSSSSWTLPSHVSLLTGLHTFEHRIGYRTPYLGNTLQTLPQLLRDSGYCTLGYSNNPYVGSYTGLNRGFDDFQEGWKRHPNDFLYQVFLRDWTRFSNRNDPYWAVRDDGAAKTTRYVSDWIRAKSRVPFCIFINYMEPHMPYDPPNPFDTLFRPATTSPSLLATFQKTNADIKGTMLPRNRPQEEISLINAMYDGEIRYLDDRIGELYRLLNELRILDNTLLIVTSDHGENLGDHNLVGHGYGLFHTLLRVPLIVRFPKSFAPGTLVTAPVQTPDIFYTILDVLGIDGPPSPHGLAKSLLQRRDDNDSQNFLLAAHDAPTNMIHAAMAFGIDPTPIDKDQRTIISKGFKLLETSAGENQLYDLQNDPNEINDIFLQRQDIALQLQKTAHQLQGALKPPPPRKPILPDKQTQERLRSLGYIQ